MIFDIQRYSIHDGPGIRTTVFVKGCPLRCKWCANPESQASYSEIFIRKDRCNRCGKCLNTCPLGAIVLNGDGLYLDRSRCDLCMKCVDVCLTGAISRTGKDMSVNEVVEEVSKDEIFYHNSGGGVTISGGEPLYQEAFTLSLLKECKKKGFHTALDTSGYGKWRMLDEILEYTDLVLFDIKHLDSDRHCEATGVGNEIILKNLKKIGEKGKRIWIRVPVIPGYNNSKEHIKRLADFLAEMPIEKVSLLAYHEWGKEKYTALGRDYLLNSLSSLKEEELYPLKNILETCGLKVTIGY